MNLQLQKLFSLSLDLSRTNSFALQSQFTPNSNKTLGIQTLESRGFFTQAYWYWIGVGALIGFMFLFNIVFTVALAYLNREYLPIWLFKILKSNGNILLTYEYFCSI